MYVDTDIDIQNPYHRQNDQQFFIPIFTKLARILNPVLMFRTEIKRYLYYGRKCRK